MDNSMYGWLVGFFDGEGTIELCNAHSVALTVDSTDYDSVERFQRAYGGSVLPRPVRESSPQRQWRWKLGKANEVYSVLKTWYPLLSYRRRAKADEAFIRLAGNKNLSITLRTLGNTAQGRGVGA